MRAGGAGYRTTDPISGRPAPPAEPQPPACMFDMITVCITSSIVGVITVRCVEVDQIIDRPKK